MNLLVKDYEIKPNDDDPLQGFLRVAWNKGSIDFTTYTDVTLKTLVMNKDSGFMFSDISTFEKIGFDSFMTFPAVTDF